MRFDSHAVPYVRKDKLVEISVGKCVATDATAAIIKANDAWGVVVASV